jgi:hypothetical protein
MKKFILISGGILLVGVILSRVDFTPWVISLIEYLDNMSPYSHLEFQAGPLTAPHVEAQADLALGPVASKSW